MITTKNPINFEAQTKWLSNNILAIDSFPTKITIYFNKKHKLLQQQKSCVLIVESN
jgi:hypothetical protein